MAQKKQNKTNASKFLWIQKQRYFNFTFERGQLLLEVF